MGPSLPSEAVIPEKSELPESSELRRKKNKAKKLCFFFLLLLFFGVVDRARVDDLFAMFHYTLDKTLAHMSLNALRASEPPIFILSEMTAGVMSLYETHSL